VQELRFDILHLEFFCFTFIYFLGVPLFLLKKNQQKKSRVIQESTFVSVPLHTPHTIRQRDYSLRSYPSYRSHVTNWCEAKYVQRTCLRREPRPLPRRARSTLLHFSGSHIFSWTSDSSDAEFSRQCRACATAWWRAPKRKRRHE